VHRIAVIAAHRKVVEAGYPPLRKAAAEAGLELVEIWAESPNEYAAAFDAMHGYGVEGLVIVPIPELNRDSEKLGALTPVLRRPIEPARDERTCRGPRSDFRF
jgi:hypothetical protein